jgi:mannose-6-phosphate isomerase
MTELYPLRMVPAFDPRPWGATDLSPIYPDHKFEEKIGEAWLTGDHCKAANGPLAGRTLAEISEECGRLFVGSAARDEKRFPLLLKFLFPREKLSVQVHPDDADAQRTGQPWGKAECWYVAAAKPGSQVAMGLKPGFTRADLQKAIEENRAEELLHWINIYPGEMIYVAGGTVHTLGPGSILVETQQQSDCTYRLYDYGRPRELHLREGLAAVKEKVASGKVVRPGPSPIGRTKNSLAPMIRSPYFVVDQYELKETQPFGTTDESGKSSVQILVAVEGCGILEAAGMEPVTFAKGDAAVVPASISGFSVRPQWSVSFLKAYVPGVSYPEPETRL